MKTFTAWTTINNSLGLPSALTEDAISDNEFDEDRDQAIKDSKFTGCPSPMLGQKHTEETKKLMSAIAKRRLPHSKQHIERITANHVGMLGRKHTKETKKKMSLAKQDYVPWNLDRTGVYSQETIKRMSESAKGRKLSPETIRKRQRTRGLNRAYKYYNQMVDA